MVDYTIFIPFSYGEICESACGSIRITHRPIRFCERGSPSTSPRAPITLMKSVAKPKPRECGGEAAVRAKLISLSRRFDARQRERERKGEGVLVGARLAPVKSRKRRQRVITGACWQRLRAKRVPLASAAVLRSAPALGLPLITTSLSRGRGRQFAVRAEIGIDRRRRNRNAALLPRHHSLVSAAARDPVTHTNILRIVLVNARRAPN
jgi:hypothetical protein